MTEPNLTEEHRRADQAHREKANAETRERLRPALAIECPTCNMGIERPCLESSEDGQWRVCGKRLAKSLGREDLYWLFDGRNVLRLPDEVIKPPGFRYGVSVLPLNSGDLQPKVGETIQVEDRVSDGAAREFRPNRLFVTAGHDWQIEDVTIGNRSQFVKHGPIPGVLLSADVTGHGVWLDDVDLGMKVAIVATRVAANDGAGFVAGLLGVSYDRRTLTETIPTE